MIILKKLNKSEFILNADIIESIESTPDTMITLISGKKITVTDGIEDVVKRIIKYKQLTHQTIGIVPQEKTEKPQETGGV